MANTCTCILVSLAVPYAIVHIKLHVFYRTAINNHIRHVHVHLYTHITVNSINISTNTHARAHKHLIAGEFRHRYHSLLYTVHVVSMAQVTLQCASSPPLTILLLCLPHLPYNPPLMDWGVGTHSWIGAW